MDNTLNNALRNRYLAIYVIQTSISVITLNDEYSMINFLHDIYLLRAFQKDYSADRLSIRAKKRQSQVLIMAIN